MSGTTKPFLKAFVGVAWGINEYSRGLKTEIQRQNRMKYGADQDVNECATGTHKCHKDANCINTIGSYRCKCKDGKPGNGFICNDHAAFKEGPSSKKLKTSEKVILKCSYYNSSRVDFNWVKDYEVLNTGGYKTTANRATDTETVDVTTHQLEFNISSMAEQGRYWCRIKENNVQKDSREATVIFTDSSTSEIPMEIGETYNNLWNRTSSQEHSNLKTRIKNAIKEYMDKKLRSKSRRKRSLGSPDPTVALKNIIRSSETTTRLDAFVYYGPVDNDRRLELCVAMQNITDLESSEITIKVIARKSYDCCYPSNTGDANIKGVIAWPAQVINGKSVVKCPFSTANENATRECVSHDLEREPTWRSPDTSKCMYVREATRALDDLTKETVNSTTAVTIVKKLEEVTNNQTNIKTYVDVALAVDVIVNVADSQSNNTQAFDGIVNVTNSLMSADTAIVGDAQQKSNASEKLVKAIEKFADNIPLPENQTTQTFSKKNLAIGVSEVPEQEQKDLETNGFIISGNIEGEKASVEMKKLKGDQDKVIPKVADLKLPGPLFKVANDIKNKSNVKGGLRVTTLLYDNAKLFLSPETSGEKASKKINSKVLAVGIKGIKLENLTEEQRVRSEFREQVQRKEDEQFLCVYWEESQREWSQRGCRYDGPSNTDKKSQKCSCNHLTNFALLLDVTQKPTAPPTDIKEMLKYFTYIGCALSLAGLTITLFTVVFFKNLRKKNPQRILIGICISLIFALIAFLIGTQYTPRFNEENGILLPNSPLVCLVSSVATHYFVLASFLWMLMQSYYLYLSCVKVMGIKKANIIKKMTAVSFGIPLLVVGIVLGIENKGFKTYADQVKMYKNNTSKMLMKGNAYVNILDDKNRICMINGISFYAAYLAPIGIILIANFVFLILSIRGIFGSAQKTKSKGMGKKRKIRIILSCVTIMGLTWVIGVFAIGPLKLTLQILFTIFNSLQGVFIFLFYCLMNKKVQDEWRVCLCGKSKDDVTSTSQGSRKSTSKISLKSSRRRLSGGKKEVSSAMSTSESKSNDYTSSLLALQRDFAKQDYRPEGVFITLQEKSKLGSHLGPAAETEEDPEKIAKVERDPNISTSV